ncbi:MAG: multidrug transporter subunit MdtC [Phenylobacterium sp.]|uniref:efflux RND transporter permease subunit n=1 Tax=Phenylobacterium sp. TaxID=1871053 RepID=UPI0025EEF2FD|nr:efflux RND transporter permease subunit [Phenylobacterium sp.]MBA4011671.1 multidrug transporter subunit MdtC [Phenylobacterium sp.]
MNPSRIFILRPVATGLLMAALLLAGLIAYRLLPVAALPQADYPVIQVFTFQPGASAKVTADTITSPLERRLGQIPGLEQISSSSSGGASMITLQFSLELPMSIAEQEVQAAIASASGLLPDGLPTPPIYRKVNPADAPILTLAVTSQATPLHQVHDMVDTRIAQKLSQVSGVGNITLAGGQRPAVRIQANPRALAAHGLTFDDIRTAVAAGSVNQPKGGFDGPQRSVMMDANDQLRSIEDYRALILAWREGAPIRLEQVAGVVDGVEDRRLAAWSGPSPAVLVNIQRQPGANVIGVIDRINDLLPELTATLPADVKVEVLSDRTRAIRSSITHVQIELLFAVGLVVAVTFLFLRSARATIIPAVVVPLSLIGTFGAMHLLGYSVNNLTLMALTIAAGFVVDDAIVMLENIARYLEKGEAPLAAALKGAKEIGFTLVSLTISLIAVLIPLLCMGEVVGRLFREFAVTLAVAILISLVVSLTLTPAMCARMLRPHGAPAPGFLDGVIAGYGRALEWVLERRPLFLGVTSATIALPALLYAVAPKGFFPVQDGGAIQVVTRAAPDVSFRRMAAQQQTAVQAILEDPAVESVSSFIGVDGQNATPNAGRMQINLHPHGERPPVAKVIAGLEKRTAGLPGLQLYMQPTQELNVDDQVARSQYRFSLSSPDGERLVVWTARLVERLSTVPQLRNVSSDLEPGGLGARIVIDRQAAARLGVTAADVDSALYSAFGQRQIATLFTQANQYRVVLEVAPDQQFGPETLEHVHLKAAGGGLVPLSSFASVELEPTPLSHARLGQFPATTIAFDLAPGAALGKATAAIQDAARDIGLPASVELKFQGAARAFDASLSGTLWLIIAAVVVMYIVLGVLYESLIHPVTILSTLPSAAIGALLALLLAGRPLDLIAVIGIILLIGLVKKNGIMMVDFALAAEREESLTPREAIHRAALQRFRPILMTTLAALVGALPLMFATGPGAELRQPLGLVMVGGLAVSQILTLFTTPVIYLAFDALVRRRRPAPALAAEAP